jgi:hypothetical protein
MVLGLSLPVFALLHVIISLIGIFAGLVVVGGFMSGKLLRGWTGLFLVTTILTNATGFLFPFVKILPSHILGGLSLLLLPVALFALYGKHLEGGWRKTFVIISTATLYFNCFVLVVQLFSKFPLLIATAPTQKEPPFAITHLIVLAIFVWLGRAAVKGFRSPTTA